MTLGIGGGGTWIRSKPLLPRPEISAEKASAKATGLSAGMPEPVHQSPTSPRKVRPKSHS